MDLQILTRAIGELDEERVLSFIDEFVDSGPNRKQIHDALFASQEGMIIVSKLFDLDEYHIGDLIYAGELMNSSIERINYILGERQSVPCLGKIVLATVEGDLHDIGKNIFKSLAEVAGFEVIDLGMDVKPERILVALEEEKPLILGLSAVLVLSIDYLKHTIQMICSAGFRDSLKLIIGGNAVSKEVCALVGADAYTTNAAEGVNICKRWSL